MGQFDDYGIESDTPAWGALNQIANELNCTEYKLRTIVRAVRDMQRKNRLLTDHFEHYKQVMEYLLEENE